MSARALRAFALALATGLLVVHAVARVRIDADFAAFLPAGADARQRALVQQLREGAAGRLLLIAIHGDSPERLAALSHALVARLSTQPEFRHAINGGAAQTERDGEFILRNRYALSDRVDAERFGVEGLRRALAERLEGLYGSAAAFEKQTLGRDPTGETREILRRIAPSRSPRLQSGAWFDQDGQRALLVAETSAAASDLDGQSRAIASLVGAFESLSHGSAALEYSSPGAMAVESRELIARQAARLSLVSGVLIAGILAWTYRAAMPVVLCAVPAAVGLLAGVCAVNALFGSVNGITLAFGATLLGEAVDYPSLLFTQVGRGESSQAALRRIGPLLRLAVLTTACGSLALLASGFRGLMELGVLGLTGILAAGAVTWWVISDWTPPGIRTVAGGARLRAFSSPLRRYAREGIVALVAVSVVWIGTRPAIWDDDLAHLNPLPPEAAARDQRLRGALGAPDARMFVIVRGDSETEVLERAERLRPTLADAVAAGNATGFDLVSDIMPSAATQARRRAALPAPATLHAHLTAASAGTHFRPETFAEFERDIDAARQAPLLTAGALHGTSFALRNDNLLGRDADGMFAIVPLRGVKDAVALASRIERHGDPRVAWLDLRADSAALLAAYRKQALLSTAAGIGLIFGVLAIGLRDVARAISVMMPTLAATIVAAGLLIAVGTMLTLFHLVAMLLVVGIGVNYGLFAERALRQPEELHRTVRTLLVVSSTTLCAFGTMAASTIPVLHAIGITVCLGVVTCLAASLLWFLPPRSASGARAA